jgi:hypothetical protein
MQAQATQGEGRYLSNTSLYIRHIEMGLPFVSGLLPEAAEVHCIPLSHLLEVSCPAERLIGGRLLQVTRDIKKLTMGKGGSATLTSAAAVQRLVQELQTQTSAKIILKGLNALSKGLSDGRRGQNVALWLLRTGGLAPLIRHLRGSPMSAPTADSDITPSAVSKGASTALLALLGPDPAVMEELQAATDVIEPLIDALRDAPLVLSRKTAFSVLGLIAIGQPAQRRAMGEAGVVGLLVTLYSDSGDVLDSRAFATMAAEMVFTLLESGVAAAHDLTQAILAREPARTFAAIVLLSVRHSCLYCFTLSPTYQTACKTSSCPICCWWCVLC